MLTTQQGTVATEAATQAVINAALDLPEEARFQVLVELIESLDVDEEVSSEEHQRLWAEEIRRRLADYEAGLEETIPYEVIQAEIQARYR